MIEFPAPLVSGDWLAEHLDDVHVADVRWYLDGRSGWHVKPGVRLLHVYDELYCSIDGSLFGNAKPPSR